jgi:zinc protease
MKFLFTALIALLCTTAFAQGGSPKSVHTDIIDKQVIPQDSAVRKGMLDNGMTYYVAKCQNPEKRAYFRLVVRGGSLVEKENEQGIAHYVEHMMFKGTKHFPGFEGVHSFLRRHGMPIGHDSNGYTYYEMVYYMFDKVPTDNALLLDSCLLFFRDIAGQDVTISEEAVRSEHNVIAEEWRLRELSPCNRGINNLYHNYSDYTKRLPLGDFNIIQNCSAELVRNFYKRWYQPQNMAVIVAGDIDMDKMEEKIRHMFGDIPRGQTIVPPLPLVSENETPQYHVFKDNKRTLDHTSVAIRLPKRENKEQLTVAQMKKEWIEDVIIEILKDKMKELTNSSDLTGNFGLGLTPMKSTSESRILELWADSSIGSWETALEQLLRQIELIRREGFDEDDLKGLSEVKNIYNADSTAINYSAQEVTTFCLHKSDDYVKNLIANYLEGKVVISDRSVALTKDHLRFTLPKEEFNDAFRKLTDGRNMMVFTIHPDSTQMASPQELEAVYNKVKKMSDEELAFEDAEEEFDWFRVDTININPTPGTLKKFTVRNDSISQALLSNGIKVVFWKHKTGDNKVYIRLERPSGTSVLSNEDRFYAKSLSSCTKNYRCDIMGYMVWSPQINEREDYLIAQLDSASMSNDKIKDTAFKHIHVLLTPTEVDSVKFREDLKKLKVDASGFHNPLVQSQIRFGSIYSSDPTRLTPISPELADTYNVSRLRELVKEYFSNWNGSVMVIQGEYDTDSIMPYVLKYIASLPSKPEPAQCKAWPTDHYRTTNTTLVEKFENKTPICQTNMFYTWDKGYKYSAETNALNNVLKGVINALMIKVMRVQNSDIYAGGCILFDNYHPIENMLCGIVFTCNPKERERIAGDIDRLMHEIADGDLITQELIDGYIQQREKNVRTLGDSEQLNLFTKRELYKWYPDENDLTYIRKVTPKMLKAHLRQLLKKCNLHIGYLTTE